MKQNSHDDKAEETQGFGAFVDLIYSIRGLGLLEDFLLGVTTEQERRALVHRVEIVKRLLNGQTQHEIAEDLGVGIATITRGSKEVAQGHFKVLKKNMRHKSDQKAAESGYFGEYGGRYVPEMLQSELAKLAETYDGLKNDEGFLAELEELNTKYNGRPTPLIFAANLSKSIGGAQIYLKNEGLNHTGAHKINHCLGQALVAKKMGKKRLIAETGAGQHGLATATVAAKFGFECTIYMGETDIHRQRPNVVLMELLGAKVASVKYGSKTLKDAVSGAIRDWLGSSGDTHYVIGSCLGPDPYPRMNRDFQSIIGKEIREQLGENPSAIVACVGGGSNALGAFYEFLSEKNVRLIGVEAGGKSKKPGQHAARFPGADIGIMEGYKSYFLQDEDGNSAPTHSIAAGLDYIGIGPELAQLADSGRVEFIRASDNEALEATKALADSEGIIPALESAHAISEGIKLAKTMGSDKKMVINVSGRGDKDLFTLAKHFAPAEFKKFLKEELDSYE